MKKLTKSHTTFLDTRAAELILGFLGKNKDVKSFTAGMIVAKRPPSRSEGITKIIVTDNSLKININSKRSKQEIRVYGNDLLIVARKIENHLLALGFRAKLYEKECD